MRPCPTLPYPDASDSTKSDTAGEVSAGYATEASAISRASGRSRTIAFRMGRFWVKYDRRYQMISWCADQNHGTALFRTHVSLTPKTNRAYTRHA